MGTAAQPDQPALVEDVREVSDASLRHALEFAVGIASAGSKLRPPLPFPVGLKPFLKMNRIDRAGLAAVRQAVVGDPQFRGQLGAVASIEMADELGVVWLQRRDGWVERVRQLQTQLLERAQDDAELSELRRSERRREAAELVAARAQAEVLRLRGGMERERGRREGAQAALEGATKTAELANQEASRVRNELTKSAARSALLGEQLGAAQQALVGAQQRILELEQFRDQLLADRANAPQQAAMNPSSLGQAAREISQVVRAADALEQAIAATSEVTTLLQRTASMLTASPNHQSASNEPRQTPTDKRRPLRRPIAVPGGLLGDSLAVAAHFLRTARVEVVVDGYNLAKQAWPRLALLDQRERCIEVMEDLARRYGCSIIVIFDGADVIGANARRRLVRVAYSPAGVSADDVIREVVARTDDNVPVVVATDDQAIIVSVRAMGANVVTCAQLIAAASR